MSDVYEEVFHRKCRFGGFFDLEAVFVFVAARAEQGAASMGGKINAGGGGRGV